MYEWVLGFHLPQKVRSIDLRHILVADHDRWRRLQNGLEGLLGLFERSMIYSFSFVAKELFS